MLLKRNQIVTEGNFAPKKTKSYPKGWVFCYATPLLQPSADGVEDGLEPTGDIELPEDAVQVALDRLLANEQGFADFLIRAPCSEETRDFLMIARLSKNPRNIFLGLVSG